MNIINKHIKRLVDENCNDITRLKDYQINILIANIIFEMHDITGLSYYELIRLVAKYLYDEYSCLTLENYINETKILKTIISPLTVIRNINDGINLYINNKNEIIAVHFTFANVIIINITLHNVFNSILGTGLIKMIIMDEIRKTKIFPLSASVEFKIISFEDEYPYLTSNINC
jgi:hypothetical protein